MGRARDRGPGPCGGERPGVRVAHAHARENDALSPSAGAVQCSLAPACCPARGVWCRARRLRGRGVNVGWRAVRRPGQRAAAAGRNICVRETWTFLVPMPLSRWALPVRAPVPLSPLRCSAACLRSASSPSLLLSSPAPLIIIHARRRCARCCLCGFPPAALPPSPGFFFSLCTDMLSFLHRLTDQVTFYPLQSPA